MTILIINAGSSSLRLSLFAQKDNRVTALASAHHRQIDHTNIALLKNFLISIDQEQITLVAHRVVHGGARLTATCLIDDVVEAEIEQLESLAPLHNPAALVWIRLARQLLNKGIPQLALFDTAFYKHMPKVASTYALPATLCQQYGIRRYGFHGIAHEAMASSWRAENPHVSKDSRVISLQLGSGCSISAIKAGVPVDTSMGFSPLEGLMMATRSGEIDPAIILYLQQEAGLNVEEIQQILNEQSGLLGVSAESNDMQVLLNSDKPAAKLAVELYCYRIRKYIGAYSVVLGGIDAILFGGGVGQNSVIIRAKILQEMQWMGIDLDLNLNNSFAEKTEKSNIDKAMCISNSKSQCQIWVIPVDEARTMALDALFFLKTKK